jgi:hypothetical protein
MLSATPMLLRSIKRRYEAVPQPGAMPRSVLIFCLLFYQEKSKIKISKRDLNVLPIQKVTKEV